MAEKTKYPGRVVVLPIDNSQHSERAFDWFIKVGRREGDKIVLAHLFVPPPLPAMSLYHAAVKATDEYKNSLDGYLEQAKKLLNCYEEKCKAANMDYQTHLESCQDSIGGEILQVAKNTGAEFIIIGSRGLSKARRTILGSVSEYVVHHSRIPVIVVPPENPVNPF